MKITSNTRQGPVANTGWSRGMVIGVTMLLLSVAPGCGHQESHEGHAHEEDSHAEPDGHAAHGEESGVVHMSPEQEAAAGIEVVQAGPGFLETALELAAVVAADLNAQVHVNPRVPGQVVAVMAHLGDQVAAGDPLCVIDSVERGRAVGRFLKAEASVEASEEALAREREILTAAVDLARTVHEREQELADKAIVTAGRAFEAERSLRSAQLGLDSRVLELEGQLALARIELAAARGELRILGLDEEELASLGDPGVDAGDAGRYTIYAPRDGVVVGRHITEGEFVGTSTELFEIQDLSQVWVIASVYEDDLYLLRRGARADILLDAFPGEVFSGTLDLIGTRVDSRTRTADVRIVLPNVELGSWAERHPLRPGMFGAVRVATGRYEAEVVIPESALVHEGESDFVYVRTADGSYEERAVAASEEISGRVSVTTGVAPGEFVVVQGTFALKSLARQDELGEGHEH